MRLILTQEEQDIVRQYYDSKNLDDIAIILKPIIAERTDKFYSYATIKRVIRESGFPRKHKVEKKRAKYGSREVVNPIKVETDLNRIMATTINGYKPVKAYANFVLYEKEVKGIRYKQTYTYFDLYKIFKEVDNGQKKAWKLYTY